MERRLELSTGIEVELRMVPPYVLFKVEKDLPALPDVPVREVETAAGVQRVQIDDVDDPAYQEWMKEYRGVEGDRQFDRWAAVFSHGIKRWRKKPRNGLHKVLAKLNLGYQWRDQAPENWEISTDLEVMVGSTGSKRLDYIYLMLLADAEDFAKVFQALMGPATELTTEEVEDAAGSFRDGVAGDGAPEGEGDRGAGTDDVSGDGSSEVLGVES